MAKYKFKVGDRVIVHPSADYSEWKGITGTISKVINEDDYKVVLDKRPQGWLIDFMSTADESRTWLRPLKPLSELEEQIAAYVKAEMAQL